MARNRDKRRMGRGSGGRQHALEQLENKGSVDRGLWAQLISKRTDGHPAMTGRVIVGKGDEALIMVDGVPATYHKGAVTAGDSRVMSVKEYEALACTPSPERTTLGREASTKVKKKTRGRSSRGESLRTILESVRDKDPDFEGLDPDEVTSTTEGWSLVNFATEQEYLETDEVGLIYLTLKGMKYLGAAVGVGVAAFASDVLLGTNFLEPFLGGG